MATYAIGDIQGCRVELELLLEKLQFNENNDSLWIAGDLVNRGPDSLGTLRLLYKIRKSVAIVLGNHDLHMLAVRYFGERSNNKDNFFDVFDVPDGDTLLEWLIHQPLAHAEGDFLMVHAGVHPEWTRQQTLDYASEVEQVLQSEDCEQFFKLMYGNYPEKWSSELKGIDRLRVITNVLTRMRYLDGDLRLDMNCKSPLKDAEAGLIPWFKIPKRVKHEGYILHGHWASLCGGELAEGIISLDTGCVWGNALSAWCLETREWTSVPGFKSN